MFDPSRLQQALAARAAQGTLRALTVAPAGLDFVSNDYLGLAAHPEIAAAAACCYTEQGSGSKGARLLGGNPPIFCAVETKLAAWKGSEAALIFNCGYSANVGVLSALCDQDTHLFMDRLDHASMVDGYQLSGARLHRFRHNDPANLERALQAVPAQAFKIIAVESVYSMDGDLAPLAAYADLAERYTALFYVDEAHGEGVFGPAGKGLVHALGLEKRVDLTLATFGKAYGCAGACVFGSRLLIDYLINHARSFIYSTALPPGAVAAMSAAVDVSVRESWRREHVLQLSDHLRSELQKMGFDTLNSQSQIVPVVLGSNERALSASRFLAQKGLRIAAVRPPTVPVGTARLRINLTAAHTKEQVDQLLAALTEWRELNVEK
jgi:8-amino-7-oxononanoate synthase